MKLCLALLTVGTCVSVALAQYDGPVPPRPVIPGAVPAGGARPAVRRRPVSRVLEEQPQQRQTSRGGPRRLPPPLLEQSLQVRQPSSSRDYEDAPIRRQSLRAGPRRFPVIPDLPLQSRQPQPRPLYQESPISVVRAPVLTQPQHISPRPVIEDEDDEEEEELSTFASPAPTPQALPSPQPTLPPPQPSPQVFSNLENFPVPTRQQYRPQPEVQPEEEPQQQYYRPSRPQPTRQQQQDIPQQETVTRQEPARPKPYAQQQYNRQQQVARPAQKEIAHSKASEPITTNRSRKPTSQVLKKYRDDNPDGSITWGYENDDGSFKEETIGTDCVTKGKYGYVDPDGVRREFTYSSGIPCDRARDSETQASEGYIDYSNNKYVFPNGDSIDINSMVRNRARKPVYRN